MKGSIPLWFLRKREKLKYAILLSSSSKKLIPGQNQFLKKNKWVPMYFFKNSKKKIKRIFLQKMERKKVSQGKTPRKKVSQGKNHKYKKQEKNFIKSIFKKNKNMYFFKNSKNQV